MKNFSFLAYIHSRDKGGGVESNPPIQIGHNKGPNQIGVKEVKNFCKMF